ncbi:MAG: hypothetical protein HKM89_05110, partial [Gemmatimonadales bacterium]|nr:hypothetical protein [Gemmatimonadales bacterium]
MALTNTAGDHHGLHAVAITDTVEDWARRLAHIWSIAGLVTFAALAITVGMPHGPDLETWERHAQIATLILIALGVAAAWRWEGPGGSIMLVGSVALGVFAALQHQPLVAFLPALAFLVPAVAFLVAWQRTRTYAAVVTLITALLMILFTGAMAAQAMYNYGYGAAHPQSTLPNLPDTPVVWHWAGGVTTNNAVVVARVDGAATATLALTGPAGSHSEHAGSEAGDVWRFELENLTPGTEYSYSLAVDGRTVSERIGSFSTFVDGPMSFSVAAGSCARLGSNGMVYEAILEMDPDLFLVPGDLFYADHMKTAGHFTEAFDETLTQPAQAALLAHVPVAYVWDDHDYGGNDADRTAPTRDLARQAFDTNVPHYRLDSPE